MVTILFEDQHLIIVAKPAGLLSQDARAGEPSLVAWLRDYWGRPYVGLVHRLDRNVSGVMVVAKRSKAASRLSQALRNRQLKRYYRGWLVGTLDETARWQHLLVKDRAANLSRVAETARPGARTAVLKAIPLEHRHWRGVALTLVEFELESGRSHQIRVQAAAAGLPLLGDVKYGTPKPSFPRPALHAYRLILPHPMSAKLLEFIAPWPPELQL